LQVEDLRGRKTILTPMQKLAQTRERVNKRGPTSAKERPQNPRQNSREQHMGEEKMPRKTLSNRRWGKGDFGEGGGGDQAVLHRGGRGLVKAVFRGETIQQGGFFKRSRREIFFGKGARFLLGWGGGRGIFGPLSCRSYVKQHRESGELHDTREQLPEERACRT